MHVVYNLKQLLILLDYDLIAIGGPTHKIGISKDMKMFLKGLENTKLKNIKGFSFDTRIHSKMNKKSWLMFENSAARRIERKLKKMKVKIIKPRESAIVLGREGPLEDGVEKKFVQIGRELGHLLSTNFS